MEQLGKDFGSESVLRERVVPHHIAPELLLRSSFVVTCAPRCQSSACLGLNHFRQTR